MEFKYRKVVPLLNTEPTAGCTGGMEGGTAPLILNLKARWEYVVIFMTGPH